MPLGRSGLTLTHDSVNTINVVAHHDRLFVSFLLHSFSLLNGGLDSEINNKYIGIELYVFK